MENISVVGLGKLGICLSTVLAYKGFSVVGVDVNPRTVQLVNDGEPPVLEPGLHEMMNAARPRLTATGDLRRAVNETDVTFIIVPTPSDNDGSFSLCHVKTAGTALGKGLAHKSGYHVIVLVSTVLPGATENDLLPLLEETSGKRCGLEFGLCYNPEFIALGSVIKDMLSPELVIIGESDERAGDKLTSIHARLLNGHPPVVRTTLINAELAKISINAYLTVKITFANILAELCEQLPKADVDTVTRALGYDSRIGARYLKGGLGFGGPCFPRDDVAFSSFARGKGVFSGLTDATQVYNRSVPVRIVDILQDHLLRGSSVAVLGTAYKPDTPVVEESQGVKIAELLVDRGYLVNVYDPLGLEQTRVQLGDSVIYHAQLQECLLACDGVVIAQPVNEFSKLTASNFSRRDTPVVVVDCWRLLRDTDLGKDVLYLTTGLGQNRRPSLESLSRTAAD